MKRKIENWTVEKLEKERNSITFPEYQREKSLWRDEKKSLLIDLILKDIDIPKLYFNRLKDKTIEVIDGQQRLWSIWEFVDDIYPYHTDKKRLRFSEMSASQRREIQDYTFQVTVACTRFRRHRVRCFDGTGGVSWRDGSLHGSSSLRLYG